jgi:CRP/FNR family transcriptional regulator, anaerobic regulatory protein
MQAFINHLNQFVKLSPEAQARIRDVCRKEVFPKHHILVPDLAKCERLYFIETGLLRAFFWHEDKEITDWFGVEGMIIGPVVRHFPIKETMHPVELLENSTLTSVSFADLEKLYQEFHEIERLGRLIAIQSILMLQFKLDSIQLLPAKARYRQFIAAYPSILQRAPLGHIAAYLGMNPVTLSRIRKEK